MDLSKRLGIKLSKTGRSYSSFGLFQCPLCGKTVERTLSSGRSAQSCGCLKGNNLITHGATRNNRGGPDFPIYRIYRGMILRCGNPKDKTFQHYGARGIYVCPEWKQDFLAFKKWASENKWERGLEIDRIDNNGPYSPGNCQIITHTANVRKSSQAKLTMEKATEIRRRHKIEGLNGVELAVLFEVHSSAIYRVLNNVAWTEEK